MRPVFTALCSSCFTASSDIFGGNAAVFGKVYFPRLVSPISTVLFSVINVFIQLAMFLIFWVYYLATNQIAPNYAGIAMLPVIIVCALAVVLFIYMRYTKQGYEISVVGESENTAYYAAINVKHVIIRTMAICGGIGGIAGYLLAAGVGHTISVGISGGRGFTAIVVAWLG